MSRIGIYDLHDGFIPYDDCQQEKPKQTNADRIRSLSDEELAEFLESKTPWYRCDNCKWESCKDCCLDWLKGEADEDQT